MEIILQEGVSDAICMSCYCWWMARVRPMMIGLVWFWGDSYKVIHSERPVCFNPMMVTIEWLVSLSGRWACQGPTVTSCSLWRFSLLSSLSRRRLAEPHSWLPSCLSLLSEPQVLERATLSQKTKRKAPVEQPRSLLSGLHMCTCLVLYPCVPAYIQTHYIPTRDIIYTHVLKWNGV